MLVSSRYGSGFKRVFRAELSILIDAVMTQSQLTRHGSVRLIFKWLVCFVCKVLTDRTFLPLRGQSYVKNRRVLQFDCFSILHELGCVAAVSNVAGK
jgi:hypothetical protein